MVGNEVTKPVISCEQDIVGPGNLETDCFVKENDMDVLRWVDKGSELPDNEPFIVSKFSDLMRIDKEDCCFGCCKGDCPLTMHPIDFLVFETPEWLTVILTSPIDCICLV